MSVEKVMDGYPHGAKDHPLSEKQTDTDDHKLSTAVAAVIDPKFPLPVLDDVAGPVRYVLSFGTLALLLGGGIAMAWMMGVELLQSSHPVVFTGGVFIAVLIAMFLTGIVWIDWYELVMGYWWLSMPIGALAGLAIVLNHEASTGLEETA